MGKQEVLSYFEELERQGIILGLERIQQFLSILGNPQDSYRAIHIAGTNGKGSVAAMVASILQQAGYKVGLYTSPHLVEFNERIQINGKNISDADLGGLVQELRKTKEERSLELTYFEFTTALAFKYFASRSIDFAVIEVGMGGRLDATNVIKPAVSIITNIALEHEQYLGNTLEKIAFEKAGIIKEGVPLITAEKNKAVLNIFRKVCEEKCSRLVLARKLYDGKISLHGDFQKINAAMAIAAVRELQNQGIRISEAAIRKGIATAHWPGRFDIVQHNPTVILDCCHNPGAAPALAKAFKKAFPKKKAILVIGVSSDKNIAEIAASLVPLASHIIVTEAKIRAMDAGKIKMEFEKKGKKAAIVPNVTDAVKKGINEAGKKGLVLVTGSCFVVGEAIQLWSNSKREDF